MIATVTLLDGESPPDGESYLVIEWRTSGAGVQIVREPLGLRYLVAPDKHAFWTVEARHLAKRMKLGRVYYVGYPRSPSWSAAAAG
ncbi:hypothetical protein ACFSCV_19100 [Methylopila henanensis]|uniref:Uncharacterized protein n=1 Tax=Methylopila henanensis TaxID=873516 RepID=A0ABW4KAB1_9HYPH